MQYKAAYEVFSTLLNLLSTVRPPIDAQYQEVALINQLNGFFGFDHNIFLLDSTTDPSRFLTTSSTFRANDSNHTPQSVYIFDGNTNKTTKLATLNKITSKNPFLIVVTEIVEFQSSLELLSQVKMIRGLNTDMKIGVFFAQSLASMDIIEKLFQWSWKHRILNIFAAFYLNVEEDPADSLPLLNVFKFNPFGTFTLVNVTRSESFQNYFPDKLSNWKKHPLRFANMLKFDITFFDTQLWKTVTDVFNASLLTIGNFSPVGLYYIDDDVYDIVPYNRLMSPSKKNNKMYPLRIDTVIMIVPHALPYSGFVAYLQSIASEKLFIYTFIMIASAALLLIISGYLKTKKILFFQCVADVLNLLMNDNGSIRYQQLCRADVFVIVPLTFAGLIFVNDTLSTFQSFLTSPIYQPQIKTIEDLYKSTVPIVTHEMDWASEMTEILENLSQHGGWSDKVRTIGFVQLTNAFETFNNSIAFTAPYDQAQALLEVQKRLHLKAYHLLPELYLNKFMVSYQINDNLPFIERINDIVLRLQNAGLVNKWQEELYKSWMKKVLRRNLKFHGKSKLDIDESTVPTLVWYILPWIATVLVFICEVIWNKCESSRMIRMLKK